MRSTLVLLACVSALVSLILMSHITPHSSRTSANPQPLVTTAPAATASPASPQTPAGNVAPPQAASPTIIGVYSGPGAVRSHEQFELWLGRAVPLATDYVDYKGGWQKDFIDS